MTANTDNPFDGYEPPARADSIILNAPGAWFEFKVTEVGQPFEAEYGDVYVTNGVITRKGGDVDAPDAGEEAGYLTSWAKVIKGQTKPGHVREEITKAVKAAGRRSGSVEVGDVIAVMYAEDVEADKNGKRFKNPFKRHQARVIELAPDRDANPFGGGDVPF
jgi:hypothetical protein